MRTLQTASGRLLPVMDPALHDITDVFISACATDGGNLTDSIVREAYINLLAEYQVASNDFTRR